MSGVQFSEGYLAGLRRALEVVDERPTIMACQPAAQLREELAAAELPLSRAKRHFRALLRRRTGRGGWSVDAMTARYSARAVTGGEKAVVVVKVAPIEGHPTGYESAFEIEEDGKIGRRVWGSVPLAMGRSKEWSVEDQS